MTLISATHVDQPVRAQTDRLCLQRGDALGLARIARKPEGGAPRIHPKMAHDVILTLCELLRFIDLDFDALPFDAALRCAGAAAEHADVMPISQPIISPRTRIAYARCGLWRKCQMNGTNPSQCQK